MYEAKTFFLSAEAFDYRTKLLLPNEIIEMSNFKLFNIPILFDTVRAITL